MPTAPSIWWYWPEQRCEEGANQVAAIEALVGRKGGVRVDNPFKDLAVKEETDGVVGFQAGFFEDGRN